MRQDQTVRGLRAESEDAHAMRARQRRVTMAALDCAAMDTAAQRRACARQWAQRLASPGARRDLADALVARATAIQQVRARRAAARQEVAPRAWPRAWQDPAWRRTALRFLVLERATAAIRRRGLFGSTWRLPTWVDSVALRGTMDNPDGILALVSASGPYRYRGHQTYYRRVAWLAGRDDSGWWAVRVPQRCTTVQEAVAWLEPPAVRQARAAGRWTARQGDIYLVAQAHGPDRLDILRDTRHTWDPAARVLAHPQHRPLVVPATVTAVRAYRQGTVGSTGVGYWAD
jgi:hypothetical protein